MIHKNPNMRPKATILLKNFRSWQARNDRATKLSEEVEELKKEKLLWENKYKKLKQKLLENELHDFLSDSEEERD